MKFLPCLLLLLSFPALAERVQPSPWLLLGTHASPAAGQSLWCADTEIVQRPLARKEDYAEAQKAFHAEFKGKSPSVQLLGPHGAALVFTYRTRVNSFNCDKQAAGVVFGVSLKVAEENLRKRVQEYRKSYLTEPQIVLRWRDDHVLPRDESTPKEPVLVDKARDNVSKEKPEVPQAPASFGPRG